MLLGLLACTTPAPQGSTPSGQQVREQGPSTDVATKIRGDKMCVVGLASATTEAEARALALDNARQDAVRIRKTEVRSVLAVSVTDDAGQVRETYSEQSSSLAAAVLSGAVPGKVDVEPVATGYQVRAELWVAREQLQPQRVAEALATRPAELEAFVRRAQLRGDFEAAAMGAQVLFSKNPGVGNVLRLAGFQERTGDVLGAFLTVSHEMERTGSTERRLVEVRERLKLLLPDPSAEVDRLLRAVRAANSGVRIVCDRERAGPRDAVRLRGTGPEGKQLVLLWVDGQGLQTLAVVDLRPEADKWVFDKDIAYGKDATGFVEGEVSVFALACSAAEPVFTKAKLVDFARCRAGEIPSRRLLRQYVEAALGLLAAGESGAVVQWQQSVR